MEEVKKPLENKKRPTEITIKDIAQLANTSHATVSRVLSNPEYPVSEALRARVLKIADAYNYVPNLIGRTLKGRMGTDVGVIVPNFSNPFYATFLSTIEKALGKNGLSMLVVSTSHKEKYEKAAFQKLLMRRVGSIVMLSQISDTKLLHDAAERGTRLVMVNDWLRGNPCDNIYADSEHAGQIATEHLIGLNHTRIGYISSPLDKYSRSAFHLGYLKALTLNNIRFRPEQEVLDQQEQSAASEIYEYERGVALTEQLLSQCPDITAIIACNDYMAIGAMAALHAKGLRVPEDVSIVGRDNIPMARMVTPALTTVSEPIPEMTNALLTVLGKPLPPDNAAAPFESIVFNGELILRDSTATAR